MPIIEISSLSHPGVEIFSTLTEAQLRNRIEPTKGIFIAESPKVISVAIMQDINLWHSYANRNTLRVMPQPSLGRSGDNSGLYRNKRVACHAYRIYPDPRRPLRHASPHATQP